MTQLCIFRGNSSEVSRHINKWVEDQTHQKIKNILPSGAVSELTRLVLVNAIYFKGDWSRKFNRDLTDDKDFHVTDTNTIRVPMMKMSKAKMMYGVNQDLDCQALELPYVGDSLTMTILLPDPKITLQQLVTNLRVEHLMDTAEKFRMKSLEVDIWLPRFHLDEELSLAEVLAKMGVRDLFSERAADLSAMNGRKDLFISKALHKAFIEVNEEGSEAAAATAVVANMRSAPMSFKFHADHPFLFFIRDTGTGSILFLGSVVKPSKA